jgi:hypothetical protein
MSRYSISPDGVSSVTSSVAAEVEALPDLHTAIQGAGDAAVAASGTGAVSQALTTFFADRLDSLPALARQAGACTTAATTATAAYVAADLAMALIADAAAATARNFRGFGK